MYTYAYDTVNKIHLLAQGILRHLYVYVYSDIFITGDIKLRLVLLTACVDELCD